MARSRLWKRADFWTGASGLLALGSATLAIAAPLATWALGIGAAAIAAFVGSIVVRRRERTQFEKTMSTLRSEISVDTLLYRTAQSLDLGARFPGWRVSLYKMDRDSRTWIETGRASSNPHFELPSSLSSLLDTQGILRGPLGGADRSENASDVTQVFESRASNLATWMAQQASWGISPTRATAMRMSSRSYWGQVYRMQRGDKSYSTLGLVIESESANAFVAAELESRIGRPLFEALDAVLMMAERVEALTGGSDDRHS